MFGGLSYIRVVLFYFTSTATFDSNRHDSLIQTTPISSPVCVTCASPSIVAIDCRLLRYCMRYAGSARICVSVGVLSQFVGLI